MITNMLKDLEIGDRHNFEGLLSESFRREVEVCQCFITNGLYKGMPVFYLCDPIKVVGRSSDFVKIQELSDELFPNMEERIRKARQRK